jgi:hypothetical protein
VGPERRIVQRLFDYLVGACEHGRWDVDAERLCSFEVDNQLVFGCFLFGVPFLRPPVFRPRAILYAP